MNSSKVLTVIAGFAQCSDYSYACFIAENLSKNLPNFSVKKITINYSDWKVRFNKFGFLYSVKSMVKLNVYLGLVARNMSKVQLDSF